MKIMSAREAKNRFGEFLDTARREPVVITKNDRPVGVMISIEDAADTVLPELLLDKEPGYDGWLFEKVSRTIEQVDAGELELVEHGEAMARVRGKQRRASPSWIPRLRASSTRSPPSGSRQPCRAACSRPKPSGSG